MDTVYTVYGRVKTKARDVISGWARGRSTESLTYWDDDYWTGFFNYSLYRDSERQADRERNRIYHLQQAVMEETFLAGRDWKRTER